MPSHMQCAVRLRGTSKYSYGTVVPGCCMGWYCMGTVDVIVRHGYFCHPILKHSTQLSNDGHTSNAHEERMQGVLPA